MTIACVDSGVSRRSASFSLRTREHVFYTAPTLQWRLGQGGVTITVSLLLGAEIEELSVPSVLIS